MGRLDLLLSIASELAIAEIVEDYEKDVRFLAILRHDERRERARGKRCRRPVSQKLSPAGIACFHSPPF